MRIIAHLVLLLPLAGGWVAGLPSGTQSRDGSCTEWHDCRQLALAAASRGDYETFHDLAWRTVQTGPPKDPALMYLLARAQALSGRPHDALVMLERLAEMGVASDAATNDDFTRTRQLPGWPEVAARIDRVIHPGSPPPDAAPEVSNAPAAVASVPNAPAPALEAVRFSTKEFTFGGLAYDAVSHRFVFGDRLGRKLIIVGEGSSRPVDYVRADSAGFHDIAALEIDARRGDLWVATAAADGAGTLHKLQLVSGRPLRSFRVDAGLEPVTLVDLAVTPAGAVLLLDSAGRQLLALPPGATALERVVRIDDAREPASVAAGGDDGIAYVAHRDGLSRIDLRARTATPVAVPSSVRLARLEWIRWHRHALVGIRVDDDGSRRIVQLELSANGRAVTKATTLEGSVPSAGQTFVTVSGDELVYLVDGSTSAATGSRRDPSAMAEFVAYRVRLP